MMRTILTVAFGLGPAAAALAQEWPGSHSGQVVFASSRIDADKADVKSFKTSFKAGQHIYATFVLPKKPADIRANNKPPGEGWYDDTITTFIRITIDGKQVVRTAWYVMKKEYETGVVAVDLLPDPKESAQGGPATFGAQWRRLDAKVHKVLVAIELSSFDKVPDLATGELEIDCTANLDKLVAIAKANIEAKIDRFLGEAQLKDEALEKQALAAVAADDNPPATLKVKLTPLKAVITTADWEIQRHEATGVILSRTIGANVLCKTPDGNYWLYYLTLKQEYDGSGYGKCKIAPEGEVRRDWTEF